MPPWPASRRIRVPDLVPLEFYIVFPTGIVRATGFPDTPIDLGF